MNRFSLRLATVAALLLASCTLGKDDFNSKLVISEVSRKIDLSTQLAKVSTSVTLENAGDSSIGYFHLAIEPSLVDKLAYVGVMVSFHLKISLDAVPTDREYPCVIIFNNLLSANLTMSFHATYKVVFNCVSVKLTDFLTLFRQRHQKTKIQV